MTKEKESDKRIVYLEYWDKGKLVTGYFELVKKTDTYVSIKTKKNIIEISRSKIDKLKEQIGR